MHAIFDNAMDHIKAGQHQEVVLSSHVNQQSASPPIAPSQGSNVMAILDHPLATEMTIAIIGIAATYVQSSVNRREAEEARARQLDRKERQAVINEGERRDGMFSQGMEILGKLLDHHISKGKKS